MFKFLLAVILAFALVPDATAREYHVISDGTEFIIGYVTEDDGSTTLAYQGNITWTGATTIGVELIRGDYARLEMHSPGGLAVAGYMIGGALRNTNTPMVVQPGHICLSACAYAALEAPDLSIQGLLGFHMPYIDTIQTDRTFRDYGAMLNGVTLQFAWFVMNAGYNYQFVSLIALESSPKSFLVFTNENDLYQFRTNPLTLVEETDTLYEILTEDEVIRYMK